ncbi:MAG: O-antigen ligase family protein [Clostridia bacterium]|nr:O-antigen ligase family protein [Clostridia bacterium]
MAFGQKLKKAYKSVSDWLAKKENGEFCLLFLFVCAILPYFGAAWLQRTLGEDFYYTWRAVGTNLLGCVAAYRLIHNLLTKKKLYWPSCFVVAYGLYKFTIYVSTGIHSGWDTGIINGDVALILILCLLSTDGKRILKAVSIISMGMIIVTALSMFFPIETIYGNIYFAGGKNALSMMLFPAAFFVLLNSVVQTGKPRKTDLIFLVLSICTVLFGRSGVGIIVTGVLLLGIVLFLLWKKPWKWLFISLIALGYILLVFFTNILIDNSIWGGFTHLLGKSSTLTARTQIWDVAMDVIAENLFIGVGRGTKMWYFNDYGEWMYKTEAHNFLVEIFLTGGIVSFILYAWAVAEAVKGLNMRKMASKIIFLALCIVFVNGLGESSNNQIWVVLTLFFAYYCSRQKPQGTALWTED